jgi:anti-anti-sigma factor
MGNESDESLFQYKLHQKNELCIISFSGVIDGRSKKIIQACLEELMPQGFKIYVLNFQNVTSIEQTGFREIVQLQNTLRRENKNIITVTELRPHLKNKLSDNGILRTQEYVASLKSAISKFAFA